MDRKRCMTPPPATEPDGEVLPAPPSTPGFPHDGLPRTTIPPSPGGPRRDTTTVSTRSSARLRALRAPPPGTKRSLVVGVKKTVPKTPALKKAVPRVVEKRGNVASSTVDDNKKNISLMDLPGEIRNLIYEFTSQSTRQALLVHRPRIASLRDRTRLDRQRTLASDVTEKEQNKALPASSRHGRVRASKPQPKVSLLARDTNRPFFGLTQVCRLLRQEFRPLYMQKQEIGMDLTEVVKYLEAFYTDAPACLKGLSTAKDRKIDMPFTGNLTIAVGDQVKDVEKAPDGVDVWPLLDLWANSYKIEAGFGRYMQAHYNATADGEAKDLYRLFGRRVQPDRRCSNMNTAWRTILRTRSLAAIIVHRRPVATAHTPPAVAQQPPTPAPRPYLHIIFRKDAAEPWMREGDSKIPAEWLRNHGFSAMEHFEVKVGVATVHSD